MATDFEEDDTDYSNNLSMSSAQRNSFIGQQVFEDEESIDLAHSLQEHERAISIELHRYGGDNSSPPRSAPIVDSGNGGLQSSSSIPTSSRFFIPRSSLQSVPSSTHSEKLSNGGLQESSSQMELPTPLDPANYLEPNFLSVENYQHRHHHQRPSRSDDSNIPEVWKDQDVITPEPKTGASRKNRIRGSDRVKQYWGPVIPDFVIGTPEWANGQGIIPVVHANTPEEVQRLESDPNWENIEEFTGEDYENAHWLSGDSTANYTDDSDTSSLRTFDSVTGVRKYPTFIPVELPKASPENSPKTNGITEEDFTSKRKSRTVSFGSQGKPVRPNPFTKTPPEIRRDELASSSSKSVFYLQKVRRSSSDPRQYYSRRQYRQRHQSQRPRGPAFRPYSRLPTPESLNHASHRHRAAHAQVNFPHRALPQTPPRARLRQQRYNLSNYTPIKMIGELSPNPKTKFGPPRDFVVNSPPPVYPSKKWHYTKKERSRLKRVQKTEPSPREFIYPQPHIVTRMEMEERQAEADRGDIDAPKLREKYSLNVLLICALTLFLLPFYATGRLDWVVTKYTSGTICHYMPKYKRAAWFVFVGEIIIIFVTVVLVIAVLKATSP